MKRFLLSLLFVFALNLVSFGQIYFTPVWSGNGLDHMNIYVTSATIDGVPIQPDDEIGVFDGSYCVGAVARGQLLTPYLEIRVSKDDPLTPEVDGYQEGNLQYFRIWQYSTGIEYQFPVVNVTSGDVNFTIGGTTMVTLQAKTNKPPVADAGQSIVVDEGALVKIIGTNSKDPDGDALTYSWSVLPTINGLDLTNDTLIFNAPEVNSNTLYNFTLIVNDGKVDSDPDFMSLYVRNANKIPVITGQNAISTNEDTPLTILIGMVIFDDPDPAQTHTLKVFPGNYLINNNTITPLPDYNGTLTVPVMVSDGIANSQIYNLTVTVNPVNDPPKFTSTPSVSTLQGQPYIYSLTAEDVDGDVLTYTATTVPSWLTLTNDGNNKGTLSGTPAVADIGNHNIVITLNDGTVNVTQSLVLNVKPVTNAPELITSELPVAYVGSAYSATLNLYDFDSDSVFVSLQNKPSWLSLEGQVNGVARLKITNQTVSVNIIGTPSADALGTIGLNILFNDKANFRSKILPLKVLPTNTKPVAQDLTLSTYEDEAMLLVLKGTDSETPYGLIYNIYQQPKHGSLSMIGPRLYLYYPESNYFGKDTLFYSVFEQGLGALGDSAMVEITISPVNDQPVITADQTKFTLSEGSSVTVPNVSYNDDIDGILADNLQLITIFGPFSGSYNKSTHIYTPDAGFYGEDIVFLAAMETSADGLTSEPLMLRFNVTRVNKPPFASVNAVNLVEDVPVTFIPLVYDREDDLNNLLIELTDFPDHGTIVKEGVVLTFTPDANWNGTDSLSFKVMDANGVYSPELKVHIYCAAINDYPDASPKIINALGASSVNLDFTSLVSDVDNSVGELTIEFLLTNTNSTGSGIFPSEISTGLTPMTFTYTSQHNFGVDYIPYRVFDGKNTSLPSLITLNNLQVTKAGAEKAVDTLISRGDYIDITWGDTVDLVFTTLTSGLNLTEAPVLEITNLSMLNGTLSTPAVFFFDPLNPLITYKAKYVAPPKSKKKARGNDTAVLFDKVGFKTRKGQTKAIINSNVDTIYVGNLKKPVPVILAPIPKQYINENQTATVDIFFSDPDTPHEKLVFDADSSVAGTTYNFNLIADGHQVLTVTPPHGFFGELVMNVRAVDTTMDITQKQFVINVLQVNQAPAIAAVDSIFYMKNAQRIISTIISDRETQKSDLVVTLTANPAAAAVQLIEKDGDITVVPATDYAQDFMVNVQVSDGVLSTTKSIKMKYKVSNSMPSLDPVNSIVTLEDVPVSIKVTPYDPDVYDPLAVTVESSNEKLVATGDITITPVSSTTGTQRSITFVPGNNESGLTDITIFADDGFKKAAQEFTVEVKPVNDDPVLIPVDNQTMWNNATLTLTLGATDIDSYVFTFAASSTNSNLDIQVADNIVTIKVLNSYFGTTQFNITVEDDSLGTDTQTVQLEVQDASAVHPVEFNQLSVFPNPVSGELYLNWTNAYSGRSMLYIYNSQGQLISTQKIDLVQNVPNRIDFTPYPSGLYLIKLQTPVDSYLTRVIRR